MSVFKPVAVSPKSQFSVASRGIVQQQNQLLSYNLLYTFLKQQCTNKIGRTAVPKETECLFVAINISSLRTLDARSDVLPAFCIMNYICC
jgi:hypothetical protein